MKACNDDDVAVQQAPYRSSRGAGNETGGSGMSGGRPPGGRRSLRAGPGVMSGDESGMVEHIAQFVPLTVILGRPAER